METSAAHRPPNAVRFLRAAALLLVLVALVTWSLSLANGFHEDDFHSIVDNPHLRSLAFVPRFFTDPTTFDRHPQNAMARPFLLVSYAFHYALGLDSSAAFIGGNVLLHLLNAALVFLLARETLRRAAPSRSVDGVALLAAGLFVLHPVQTEAVNLAHARSDLLSSTFLLAATWLYLRRSGFVTGAAALVAGALAMLTKESAVVLPLLFVALDAAAPGAFRPRALALSLRRAAPAFLLAGLYLYYRSAVLGSVGVDLSAARFVSAAGGDPWAGGERSILANLLTQTKVIASYLGLWAAPLPGRFSAAHDVAPATTLFDPAVLAAGAVLALLVAGTVFLAVRRRIVLPIALLLFSSFALAPTSSFVPLNVIMAERRLYLPAFALALVTAVLLGRLPLGRAARARGAAALLASLAVVTALRTRDYRDEATLWTAAAATSPGSPRAWTNLGNAMLDLGEPDAAASHYARAIALRPLDFLSHCNRGSALQAVAERTKDASLFAEAARAFERAIELNPRAAVLGHKLGRCRLAEARAVGGSETAYLAAAAAFETILATYPEDGLALVFLAGCCREARRPDALLAAAERLSDRHPERLDFHALRGEGLVEAGRADEAIPIFRELTTRRPDDPLAFRGLAAALRNAAAPDEAAAREADSSADALESRNGSHSPMPRAEPPRSEEGSK